jgi:hypothetical protein
LALEDVWIWAFVGDSALLKETPKKGSQQEMGRIK